MPCTLTVQCRAIFLNRLCGDESPLTLCINPICLEGFGLRHRFDLARCVGGHHPVAFIENVQHPSRIFKTQGNGAIEWFISVGAAGRLLGCCKEPGFIYVTKRGCRQRAQAMQRAEKAIDATDLSAVQVERGLAFLAKLGVEVVEVRSNTETVQRHDSPFARSRIPRAGC